MGEEERKEAGRFSEKLDRLIGNKSAQPDSDINPDCRSALLFAARMQECRAEPSAEFKENLKQKLLLKLTQEEYARKQRSPSFFENALNVFRANTGVRAAGISVAIIVIALLVFWKIGFFSQTNPPVVVLPPPTLNNPISVVDVSASLSKESFKPGEPVEITLNIKNLSRSPEDLTPYPPQVTITATSSGEIVHAFPAGEGKTLEALEETTYVITWDQQIGTGQAPSGTYMLDVQEMKAGEDQVSSNSFLPAIVIQ
jgi:hypothetical protein